MKQRRAKSPQAQRPARSPRRVSKSPEAPLGPTAALTPEETRAREDKTRKIAVRVVWSAVMVTTFGAIIWAGHAYVCGLIFLIQAGMFNEIASIRIKLAEERTIPFFRTIQWLWFCIILCYAYIGYAEDFENLVFPVLAKFHKFIAFSGFSLLFAISILSLRKGQLKYQLKQYTWTFITCFLVVGQTQQVFKMIYKSLFWFLFPASLVICNDIMAYISGMSLGRTLIKRPFLELSPNKTWEGFIGGGIGTVIFAWFFAAFLGNFPFIVCPPGDVHFAVHPPIDCPTNPLWEADTMGHILQKVLAGVTLPPALTELSFRCLPINVHGVMLAFFASTIGPFGGFLASAIKRAYGIKDFGNLIPGHGGITDRMDCQLIMCLCTAVHYSTFVAPRLTSVEDILHRVAMLTSDEQEVIFYALGERMQ